MVLVLLKRTVCASVDIHAAQELGPVEQLEHELGGEIPGGAGLSVDGVDRLLGQAPVARD